MIILIRAMWSAEHENSISGLIRFCSVFIVKVCAQSFISRAESCKRLWTFKTQKFGLVYCRSWLLIFSLCNAELPSITATNPRFCSHNFWRGYTTHWTVFDECAKIVLLIRGQKMVIATVRESIRMQSFFGSGAGDDERRIDDNVHENIVPGPAAGWIRWRRVGEMWTQQICWHWTPDKLYIMNGLNVFGHK